jgi:uncharacterized membrane protein
MTTATPNMPGLTTCPVCGHSQASDIMFCDVCRVDLRMAIGFAQLARRVSALEGVRAAPVTRAPVASPTPVPAAAKPAQGPSKPLLSPELRTVEFWLSRIGVVLVLLALAFLINYAIKEGWVGPEMRLIAGVVLGGGLLAVGLRIRADRSTFGDVLSGGGLAAWYLSGYAALQTYQLVSYGTAFALMSIVTALAFVMALRLNTESFALIAILGGLLTPLVLSNESGNVAVWLAYSAVILGLALALYVGRGWQLLLWSATLAALALALLAMSNANDDSRVARSVYVVVCALAFWIVPLLRRRFDASLPATRWNVQTLDIQACAILAPWLAVGFLSAIWDLGAPSSGRLLLGCAVISTLVAVLCARLKWAAPTLAGHVIAAASLWIAGLGLVTERAPVALLALVAVFAVLLALGRATHNAVLLTLGRAATALAWVCGLISLTYPGYAQLDRLEGWSVLAVFAGLALQARVSADNHWRIACVGTLYAILLPWLMLWFGGGSSGQALTTGSWAALGLIAVLGGLRYANVPLRAIGFITLVVTLGKLFALDLAFVTVIVRVALFGALGLASLLLGYFYRRMLPETNNTGAALDAPAS